MASNMQVTLDQFSWGQNGVFRVATDYMLTIDKQHAVMSGETYRKVE